MISTYIPEADVKCQRLKSDGKFKLLFQKGHQEESQNGLGWTGP